MTDDVKVFLTGQIRKASKEGRLTDNRELAAAGSRFFETEFTPDMIAARVESAACVESPDIRIFQGKGCHRYYSSVSMTDSYAEILNFSAEGDDILLIASTVRKDSRTYPRPTILKQFLEAPFSVETERLNQIVEILAADTEDYKDIQLTHASNGDRYLFSAAFLDKSQADYMAEWASVDSLEIQ
ncbi:hypothetical protein [Marispirochaeta sp.]|uniref:hypothetical protein n=1 Tax=Marispirochaeta sp. TaxID=2038653 RepID=UPI0029C7675C|nr:hypothetical protein [Marispirochaeta sp.]